MLPFRSDSLCVVMAPLAEITDSAFRAITFAHGADACYTEMVSAAGLYHHSAATPLLLERIPEDHGRVIAQIYGSKPEEVAYAASYISEHYDFDAIDLNAGCPAPTVVRCGGGCALMRDPPLIGRLLSSMVAATSLPITLKTRVGYETGKPLAKELAHIAEDSGASAIAMHGRFASRQHSGEIERDLLSQAVDAVRIPVLANGGINSGADALRIIKDTGAAGVMLARGAVGNPWLFDEVRTAIVSGIAPERFVPSDRELKAEVLRHLVLLLKLHRQQKAKYSDAFTIEPERAVELDFRRYMLTYFKGRPGASALRRFISDGGSYADILQMLGE